MKETERRLLSTARYNALEKIRAREAIPLPPGKGEGPNNSGVRRNVLAALSRSGYIAPLRSRRFLVITELGLNVLARSRAKRGKNKPGVKRKWCEEVAAKYRGNDCLTWPFKREWNGYSLLYIREAKSSSRMVGAHRFVCELVNGPPPSDRHLVYFNCQRGDEGCINPTHMEWRTASEIQRAVRTVWRPGRILTPDAVRSIREETENGVAPSILAKRYTVNERTVREVLSGRRWSRITGLSRPAIVRAERVRFFNPSPLAFGQDCRPVPITEQRTSLDVYKALAGLPPIQAAVVVKVLDGADLDEAAAECGLTAGALAALLPTLQANLRPYLGAV